MRHGAANGLRRPRVQDDLRVGGEQPHAVADVGHALVGVVDHRATCCCRLSAANDMPELPPALARRLRCARVAGPRRLIVGFRHAANDVDISSKNYSSWSLRGWLMARLAGIKFEEVVVEPNDADARAEILLLSPSILVPCLTYEG